MKTKSVLLSALLIFLFNAGQAQDMQYAKDVIKKLCSDEFAGRGYIDDGVNRSANYLADEFKKLRLRSYGRDYFQDFYFPVNTFPYPIRCTLDNIVLKEGADFFLHPASNSCSGDYKVRHYDLSDSVDQKLFERKIELGSESNEAFAFKGSKEEIQLANSRLNKNIVIESRENKIIYGVSTSVSDKCRLIFPDSIIDNASELSIKGSNLFLQEFHSRNVMAYIPARKKSSKKRRRKSKSVQPKRSTETIVITAHYDHLGKMGNAIFPGASDNASGVSMVLNLAKHYARKAPNKNIAFILFAGEEAGILGSLYYTKNPAFPLENITMLINLDIMGSADEGVTVVNATEFPQQFEKLVAINKTHTYIPAVKSRGKAANSDHYFFSEEGIPSFFLYSNGGPGFYHDIYDTANSIPLTNYEGVFKLLVNFIDSF